MKNGELSHLYNELASTILVLASTIKHRGDWKDAIHLLEHGASLLEKYPKIKAKLIPL